MLLTASLLWLTTAVAEPRFFLQGLGRVSPPLAMGDDVQVFPEIVSGKIVWYKGRKYMCGRAKQPDWEKGRVQALRDRPRDGLANLGAAYGR